jgi:hypothetical protein
VIKQKETNIENFSKAIDNWEIFKKNTKKEYYDHGRFNFFEKKGYTIKTEQCDISFFNEYETIRFLHSQTIALQSWIHFTSKHWNDAYKIILLLKKKF